MLHTEFILQSAMGVNYYVALAVFGFAVWGLHYGIGPKLNKEQKAEHRQNRLDWLESQK